MKIRMDSAGRVQPTEYRNLINPGQCLLCNRIGRQPEEIFANLGVELDYYGVAYLCTDCCSEISSFISAIDSETYDNDAKQYALILEERNNLLYENKKLREVLNVRISLALDSFTQQYGADGILIPSNEQAAEGTDRVSEQHESEPTKSSKG